MNRFKSLSMAGLGLVAAGAMSLGATSAHGYGIATIQPHTSGDGFVVTYSWENGFFNGMDLGSGASSNIDDRTVDFSSNYTMPSGNHAGGLIKYSQHNGDGTNGNFAVVPALGANPVHYDGTDGESLTPGAAMRESSHSNIGFGDWYFNPGDQGGVRFFGTGIQGATSLTSWNGIDSSSTHGDVIDEYGALLGDAMQFGVNGSGSGNDSARFGLAYDAAYVNANLTEGLIIGYFLYPDTYLAGPPANEFTNQFNVGTYTTGGNTLYVVDDASFVPVLVPEPASMALLAAGGLLVLAGRRRHA